MVSRLASLKTIELSSSAFIGGVAGRLGRLGIKGFEIHDGQQRVPVQLCIDNVHSVQSARLGRMA